MPNPPLAYAGTWGPAKMKKRHHHYVWKHYLEAWVTDGRVRCMRHGSIFPGGLLQVAVQKDFYRFKPLSTLEVAFLQMFIDKSRPEGRETLLGWLHTFKSISAMAAAFERLPFKSPADERVFEEVLSNLEEDYHSAVEGGAIAHLDSLRRGNADFLSSQDEFSKFIYFMSVQYFRTKKRLSATLAAVKETGGVRVEHVWPVLRHIFAINGGAVFARHRRDVRVTFLEAGPGLDFVTGDQPVINTYAIGKKTGAVEDLEHYYPVTPTRAVLISLGVSRESRVLSEEEVRFYNCAMAQAADEQLYGICDKTLLDSWAARSDG